MTISRKKRAIETKKAPLGVKKKNVLRAGEDSDDDEGILCFSKERIKIKCNNLISKEFTS